MLREILTRDLSRLSDPFARVFLRVLTILFWPLVEVRRLDRLAAVPGPAIFVCNHNNALESLVVPVLLTFHRGGRLIHFLADWMYLRLPLVGWLLRLGEPIPVYTKKARFDLWRGHRLANRHRQPLAAARERLAAGGAVGLFPEATRNQNLDELLRGRKGLGLLVLDSTAPVVPVGIELPARHRLGRMPVFGRLTVTIGCPLGFSAEREAWREARAEAGGKRELQRVREALAGHVVYLAMRELSRLCAKRYPYETAAGPSSRPLRTQEAR